jgi:hypothetical protein
MLKNNGSKDNNSRPEICGQLDNIFLTHIVLLITPIHIYLLIQLCRLRARMILSVNKPKYYLRGSNAFVDIP